MGGEVKKMRGAGGRGLGPEVEMRFCDRLAELIGRTVVVSGTFPIPVGEKVAYAPAKGKLVAVYIDGFDLLDDGDTEPETYLFANVRCVQPVSSLVKPPSGIVKPGSN